MKNVLGLGRNAAKRGFTLIELLVVIAIIALLAAILFPVFSRARENARKSSCANNLKQLGIGVAQYVQDFDETYMPRAVSNGSWRQVIYPYVKSTQVFECPSNNQKTVQADAANTTYPRINRSYGISGWVAGDDNPTAQFIAMADLNKPAQKLLVIESRREWTDAGRPGWNTGNWDQLYAGHLSGANYLFCDGHVKSYRPMDTVSPFNMWGATDTAPPSGCSARSINCDTPDPDLVSGMVALANLYK